VGLSIFPLRSRKQSVVRDSVPLPNSSFKDRGLRLMRDNRLRRLINEKHSIFPTELKELGIEFPGQWFVLVMVRSASLHDPIQSAELNDDIFRQICQTVEDALNSSVMTPWVFLDEQDVYAIVNYDSDSPEVQRLVILDVMEPAISMFLDNYHLQLRAFVSGVDRGMETLPSMHQHLLSLADYELVLRRNQNVITHDRLAADLKQRPFQFDGMRSMEVTEAFFSAIRNSRYADANHILDDLADCLINQVDIAAIPASLTKARMGYLINVLDIAVDFVRIRVDSEFFSSVFPRLDFRECDNISDFLARSHAIFAELETHLGGDGSQNRYAQSWVGDVKAHIDTHFRDPNLNVNYLSERFDLNASYLSRVFKEKVQISIPDYILGLRLQMAKTLLSRGVTVSEASERSGFGSLRSMARAFQKLEGVNPGEYRSAHMEK